MVGLSPAADETLDALGGGRVRILQRRSGYRFNLDPILLTEFAVSTAKLEGEIVDLGAGTGVISLLLARRHGLASVGLELQEGLFELAQRNVALNRCEELVTLVRGDLREVDALLPARRFRHVLCNPPYHARRSGHLNPRVEKALARHELACTPADVLRAAAYLLEPRGSLWLVFPAGRLGDWLGEALQAAFVPAVLRCVHPRPGQPANRALVKLDLQGRAALKIVAPLYLHVPGRQDFSPEVQAMLAQ